jgi:cell division protein FtsQ
MADSYYAPRSLGEQRPSLPPGRAHAAAVKPAAAGGQDRLLKRILMVIIGLMLLVVAGEVVFQLGVAPQLRLQRVGLDSDLSLSQGDILMVAGARLGDQFYALDPEAMEQRLAKLPMVQSAEVSVQFPDALSIRLRSRQAVALSLLKGEDGVQRPVQIDDIGFIFDYGLPQDQESLPVLSGIEFRNFRLGMQLPQSVVPFLQDLRQLRVQAPALYQAFSEFKIQPVAANQVEILAYTINSPVGVRLNPRLSEERALYTLRTIEMISRTEELAAVREIDFRTNHVVYTRGAD